MTWKRARAHHWECGCCRVGESSEEAGGGEAWLLRLEERARWSWALSCAAGVVRWREGVGCDAEGPSGFLRAWGGSPSGQWQNGSPCVQGEMDVVPQKPFVIVTSPSVV